MRQKAPKQPTRAAPIRMGVGPSQSRKTAKEITAQVKSIERKARRDGTYGLRKNHGLLASLGNQLGNAISPGLGGMVGTEAGKVLGNLFGWGDYEGTAPVGFDINSNSAMGFQTPTAAQIPMMHTENGCCRIKKREYIKDIFMTSIWSTEVFALNPASAKTFPWLSSVASNFEQYKFLGLAFGFRSLTANALGSVGDPSMGSVTLLTQYDVLDTTVATKIAANNALYATSCKPAENMLHPVECDPEQTPSQPLYTGVNEAPMGVDADRDLRLNYMGFTTVGTNGAPTIYNAGELWVTYDVMLYKPMIDTGQNPPETISVAQTYLAEKEAAARKQAVEECGPPLSERGGTYRV